MGKLWGASRGILIGVAYALAFLALKDAPSHLNLSVGLRLAVLLATDVRRWPTILAADVLVNLGCAVTAFRDHDFVTPSYVALYTLLQPLVILPGALLGHQYKLDIVTPKARSGLILVAALLVTALAQPLASLAIWSTYTVSIANQRESIIGLLAIYSCGAFLGGLTMAPLVALGKLVMQTAGPWKRRIPQAGLIPALKAALFLASPCAALVVIAHTGIPSPLLWTLRIGLSAVPPILLAAMYGTRGAALGMILANGAVALTESSAREPGVVEVQQIAIAFSVSAWFVGIFVSRFGERMVREVEEKDRLREALQRKKHLPDSMLRYKAAILDEVYDSLTFSRVIDRGEVMAKDEALSQHFRMLHGTRTYLRSKQEAIFPPLLEEYGLRTALTCAPIIETIRSAGEDVYLHLPASVHGVAIGAQQAIYQIVHENLAHAMREGTVREVSVRLRVGTSNGRRWLALRMKICARPVDDDQSKVRAVDEVAVAGLYELAEAYGGKMRQQKDDFWRYTTALIFDEDVEALLVPDTRRA